METLQNKDEYIMKLLFTQLEDAIVNKDKDMISELSKAIQRIASVKN